MNYIKSWFGKLFLAMIFLFVLIECINKKTDEKDHKFSYKLIQNKSKFWEYEIYIDDKLYIRQYVIPAIQTNHGFLNEKDAEKTAILTISKLEKNEIPSVMIEELDSLKINYTN